MAVISRFKPDHWAALALIGFFLLVFIGAWNYPYLSRIFPLLVSSVGIVLATIFLIDGMFGTPAAQEEDDKPVSLTAQNPASQVLGAIMLIPASVTAFIVLGYWLSSVLLISVTPRLLGWRTSWPRLALIAVVFTVVVGLGFQHLLRIAMPVGLIGEAILEARYTD